LLFGTGRLSCSPLRPPQTYLVPGWMPRLRFVNSSGSGITACRFGSIARTEHRETSTSAILLRILHGNLDGHKASFLRSLQVQAATLRMDHYRARRPFLRTSSPTLLKVSLSASTPASAVCAAASAFQVVREIECTCVLRPSPLLVKAVQRCVLLNLPREFQFPTSSHLWMRGIARAVRNSPV
jgi:hypothetical protein